MKISKVILWLFVTLTVSIALGAWSTYDYGLCCTKCLADKHVVEQQLFGITISRHTTDRDSAADYQRIFGHPCEHVFRKGGFGRSWHSLLGSGIGCGSTGEGLFIRPRIAAVSATYDAERLLPDRDVTLETFQFIDTLMPPDIQMQQRHNLPETAQGTTALLGSILRRAKTVDEWRAVLDTARQNFSDTSKIPRE